MMDANFSSSHFTADGYNSKELYPDTAYNNRLDSGLDSLQEYSERCTSDGCEYDRYSVNSQSYQYGEGINKTSSIGSKNVKSYEDDSYCGSRLDSGLDSIQSLSLEEKTSSLKPPDSGICYDFTTDFQPDKNGNTNLHRKIIERDCDTAYQIIACCPNPHYLNLGNNWNQTALHLAVLSDQPSIVRTLVVYGAKVDPRCSNGNTPLHLACGLGLAVHVDMLTEKLNDAEESAGFRNGHIVQDVNTANYEGFSPIHLAAQNGHDDIINILVKELNCDVDYPDKTSGRTALHHAVDFQRTSCIKALIDNHANIDALTWDDCSPLHVAVGARRPSRADINLLTEHGADMFLTTGDDMDVTELSTHNKRIHQMMKKRQKEQASRDTSTISNGHCVSPPPTYPMPTPVTTTA